MSGSLLGPLYNPLSFFLLPLKQLIMKSLNEYLQAYATRLFERRDEGIIPIKLKVSIGDWQPIVNKCHQNVTDLCDKDNRYTPVRGWLCFDLAPLEQIKFIAHSVVRDEDGTLYDITPVCVPRQYPFIVAEETEEIYARLNESGITEIDYISSSPMVRTVLTGLQQELGFRSPY